MYAYISKTEKITNKKFDVYNNNDIILQKQNCGNGKNDNK